MAEIFKWKCPNCNKEIKSLYKEQFEVNKEQHILAHKRNSPSSDGGGRNH